MSACQEQPPIGRWPCPRWWAAVRSAFFLLYLALVTIPYSFVAIAVRPLPPMARYWIISRWAVVVSWGIRGILGIRWTFEGAHRIPDTPCVLLAKHQSALETIVLPAELVPMVFVFKKELLRIPFFGWGIGSCPMIPIDRGAGQDAVRQVITIGLERLRQGFYVILFPEGTRVAPGTTRRYKPGGAMLAVQAGVAVVPIAHNAGDVWPRNAFVRYPGRVHFIIGEPIPTEGKTAQAVIDEVQEWIETTMRARFPWQYDATAGISQGRSQPKRDDEDTLLEASTR